MRVVVLTGAGISAESGLSTFRDARGLWEGHDPMQVATPEAYADDPGLVALVVAPYFRDAVAGAQEAWRRVVAIAAQSGIPTPAFSSSLAYYDGLRAQRLPAALIQGQRDFFGAHTYKRVDEPGVFHTLWSGDRSEIETTPSSH